MTMNRCAFKPMQFVTRWVFAAGAVLLLACNSEPSSSTSPRLSAPLAARATGDVVVSTASPDSASQDTTLDVTISGSGFASGSVAQWALAAVADPAQVRTNSTRFVNSRTLVANITISAAATTGKWDVVVTSGSKGGIGTELFTIKTTVGSECGGQTALLDSRVSLAFASLSELASQSGITGDGTQAFAGGSQGVHAKISYHDAICARSGGVVFDPDKNNYSPARKLTVYFPAGNGLGLSTAGIKIGPTVNFGALMQLGSDVTWDPAMSVGRDAKIDAKYPGANASLEFPANTATRPGYPTFDSPTPNYRITLGIAGCEALEYERTRSTRTGGFGEFQQLIGQRSSFDNSPLGEWSAARNGTWTVQSEDTGTPAGHAAQCYVSKRGSLVKNGSPMHMPFRVAIAEVQ